MKKKYEGILEQIQNNDSLITRLVQYLEINNLLPDFYSKVYYIVEKSEPIYKIRYYKSKINGRLFNMYDIKNSYDLSKENLEDYIVYVYDEIRYLQFDGHEINKENIRYQEHSKSYTPSVQILPLNVDSNNCNLIKLIKNNPLLFIDIIVYFDINMNELDNIDEKNYTYKKEIRNN